MSLRTSKNTQPGYPDTTRISGQIATRIPGPLKGEPVLSGFRPFGVCPGCPLSVRLESGNPSTLWRGWRAVRFYPVKQGTPEIRRLRREIRAAQFQSSTVAEMKHLLRAMVNAVKQLERTADENL